MYGLSTSRDDKPDMAGKVCLRQCGEIYGSLCKVVDIHCAVILYDMHEISNKYYIPNARP